MRRFLILATLVAMTAGVAQAASQAGRFALQQGSARSQAFLRVTKHERDDALTIWYTPLGGGSTIRDFDVDMTKRLHLIIISDDFKEFIHVHPILQPNGQFIIKEPLRSGVRYDVYADATPHGFGQQVFRFTLGSGPAAAVRDLSERRADETVDGYNVRLSSMTLPTGQSLVALEVDKNGKPATDLRPYLGAAGHAVFISASDLSYVHVHPMDARSDMQQTNMAGMNMSAADMESAPLAQNTAVSPKMQLHVELAQTGTYKVWFQFNGGGRLHVATFVIRGT